MSVMKLARKVSVGLLLMLGLLVIVPTTTTLLDQQSATNDKRDATMLLIILGLAPTATGMWLIRGLHGQYHQEVRDRLLSTFFELLQNGNGKITVLGFAMATHLPAAAAKQYLDARAREFGATFQVTEAGGVIYEFYEHHASSTYATSANLLFSSYWTIGSTRQEVLTIQGVPHRVLYPNVPGSEIFCYGLSHVRFKDGRVVEYTNRDNNLRGFVAPSARKHE